MNKLEFCFDWKASIIGFITLISLPFLNAIGPIIGDNHLVYILEGIIEMK